MSEINAEEQAGQDVPEPGDGSGDADSGEATESSVMTVEDLITTLETVTAERDQYLDALQRLQAEFENFRRRSAADSEQRVAAGIARLAEHLLPVLDGCDAAVSQGLDQVAPIHSSLTVTLEKEGLERISAIGQPFDPTEHEAVLHEAGDGAEQVVIEELRSGYRWKGRVLRAAMVKVRS